MFKSLREKLGNVVKKFSKEVEEEGEIEETKIEDLPEEEIEEVKEEVKNKRKSEEKEPEVEDFEEEKEPEVEEKKSLFGKLKEKVTTTTINEEKFEELFWDIEITLLENNMAQEAIDQIKQDLKEKLVDKRIPRTKILEKIRESLIATIEDILSFEKVDLEKEIKQKKPYVVAIIGINGSGKTTSLAKLIHLFKSKKLKVVVAASDTFRAAAIQQLEEHTTKLDVKLIKQDYKSDPAAVAFDAIKHAKAKDLDVVLIDTAGRLHNNQNLMQELKKIDKVCKPDMKIFVGESITGNDCIEQAKAYNEIIGIDGIILSKVDIDDKGGTPISISKVTGKPILYIGNGQNYEDLEEFDKQKIIDNIL
ncbi:MAG: signal recognition particle-docking protein FtsY [Candidatus Woesearchaeota archaeon]